MTAKQISNSLYSTSNQQQITIQTHPQGGDLFTQDHLPPLLYNTHKYHNPLLKQIYCCTKCFRVNKYK